MKKANVYLTSGIEATWLDQFQTKFPTVNFYKLDKDFNYTNKPKADVIYFSYDINVAALTHADFYLQLENMADDASWVQSGMAGVETPLSQSLISRSSVFTNAAGIHSIPMAHYVLAQMLRWCKRIDGHLEQQKHKIWQPLPGDGELTDKKLGIIGYGGIGKQIAKLGKCMGMYVTGIRRVPVACEYADCVLDTAHYDEVIQESDYLVMLLPATEETKQFMNYERLQQMKPKAALINVGRGVHIVEEDLISSLKDGKPGFAVLDATTIEPLPTDSPLWDTENCYITPHDSPYSLYALPRMHTFFMQNLEKFLNNEELGNTISA